VDLPVRNAAAGDALDVSEDGGVSERWREMKLRGSLNLD